MLCGDLNRKEFKEEWIYVYVWLSYFAIQQKPIQVFPGSSVSKESACNAGDQGSIPRSGGSPGEGNGNPLQYSCLENSMDRGAWWATVHGDTKSQTQLT